MGIRRRSLISITLEPDTAKRVDRLAEMAGIPRSHMIEQLVEDGLEQQEQIIRAATDPVIMGAVSKALSEPGMLSAMMASMRDELSDEQLKLFKNHMDRVYQNTPSVVEGTPGRKKKTRRKLVQKK